MSKLVLDHKVIREILDKNPEFEVEIRSKILKTALSGRAMSIKDSKFDEFAKGAEAAIVGILEDSIGKWSSSHWNKSFELNKKVKNEIETEVGTQYRKMLRDMVGEVEKELKEYAKGRLSTMEKSVDEHIEKTVNQGVANLISEKVKEELEKIREGLK
jgi:hypothetical protein